MNTSIGLFFTDAFVVSLNLFIFGIEEFLYAILSIAITSIVMTYIETGINRKKSVMVMSEHYLEDIRLRLSAEIGRGLTLLEAKGGYNRKSKEVLLIVVTDHEFYNETIDRRNRSKCLCHCQQRSRRWDADLLIIQSNELVSKSAIFLNAFSLAGIIKESSNCSTEKERRSLCIKERKSILY